MPDFHLFRVRVEASRQTDLWFESSATDSPILSALEENPTAHSRSSGQWHIGGLIPLHQHGYYFKLGRITKRIEPQWDPDRQDFIDVEAEPAPYTHALLDLTTQVCGLALNPDIASTVRTLGNRLAMLLNASRTMAQRYTFYVAEISNPDDFVTQVRQAYAIRRFSFTARRPNFPDPSELGHAAEEYARETNASYVRLYATGVSLNPDRVERQIREALDRGRDVSARIEAQRGAKGRTIKPKHNPMIVGDRDVETHEQKRAALELIRRRYSNLKEEDEEA